MPWWHLKFALGNILLQRAILTLMKYAKGHKLGLLLQPIETHAEWPLLLGHSILATYSAVIFDCPVFIGLFFISCLKLNSQPYLMLIYELLYAQTHTNTPSHFCLNTSLYHPSSFCFSMCSLLTFFGMFCIFLPINPIWQVTFGGVLGEAA